MKKAMTAAIAVILVIILVVIGLNYSGLLTNLLNNNNNTTTSIAPNVVTSTDVSQAFGGTWTHSSSGHGTSGNVSTFFNVLSGSSSSLSVATPAASNSATPYAVASSSPNQPFENISGFQFSVFSPNHAGFAAIGYATFASSTNANSTFNLIYSNVTASNTTNQSQSKGTVSGHEYVYTWSYLANTTLTPKNQNESMLVGVYGNSIVAIFYLTPNNMSLNAFTTLYLSQISKMSTLTTTSSIGVFVSASTVGNNIGNTWKKSLGIDVQISNATSILHEFIGSASSSNVSTVDMSVFNETVGNLTEIALQGYSAGNTNATSIGFAKFMNDKVSFLVYTTAEASFGSNKNATTGTISSDNISYVYIGEPVPSFTYNSSSNSSNQNISVLFANYNDYVIYIAYIGNVALTQSQLVSLLKAEVTVV